VDSDIPDLRQDREIQLAHERPFRLGAVEIRPATREVVGPRGRAVLEPRVMQVLVALARAPGEVIARDDLIASCWEGRIVGEDAISRVISRLRRLSEGVGRDGWTLETVTKVGYRLLPAGHDPENRLPRPASGAPPSRRILLATGGAMAATAAGGFLWWTRRPQIPATARELYLKGREALRPGLPEDNTQAQGFLREAVAQAPDYAEAWGALAFAYQSSLLFTDPARQAGVSAQAEAAAKRALDLNPNEAQANAVLALLAPVYRHWAGTEKLYKRALALHARDPQVEWSYARLLMEVGRIRAAVEHAQAAVAGDPFAVWHRLVLAYALWAAGRIEEADLALAKALARWPRHYALWFLQLSLLAFTGRADRAVAFGEDVSNRPFNIPVADIEVSMKGVRALQTRSPETIADAIATNVAASRRGGGYAENAMGWLAVLGRMDDAFAVARALYLDEGFTIYEQRFSSGRFDVARRRHTYVLFTPQTLPMRSDPRFGALMRDVGIADYWKTTGHGPDDPAWARGA
jgi:DNA-binding winged helix-turn-helix (wHTH) protein/tetratricopeptide (TPR) repeat protein